MASTHLSLARSRTWTPPRRPTRRRRPAYRDPVVWYLGGMSVLVIINGVQHVVAYWTSDEVGVSPTAAGLYTSLTFASSLVGKVVWGVLLDRAGWQRRVAAVVGCLILAVGVASPCAPPPIPAAALGPAAGQAQLPLALIFGAGWGAAFTLVQSPRGSTASARTCQAAVDTAGAVRGRLGVWTTSTLRDRATGSFVRAAILPVLGLFNCVLCVRVWRWGRGDVRFHTNGSTYTYTIEYLPVYSIQHGNRPRETVVCKSLRKPVPGLAHTPTLKRTVCTRQDELRGRGLRSRGQQPYEGTAAVW